MAQYSLEMVVHLQDMEVAFQNKLVGEFLVWEGNNLRVKRNYDCLCACILKYHGKQIILFANGSSHRKIS